MTEPAGPEPDDVLAERARRGEQRAYDLLIDRHKGMVYRLARRYLGNADDAYDIVQETFISGWETLGRFDTRRPFGAWVRVIALNKCRDQSRRTRVRRLILKLFLSESETAAPSAVDRLGQAASQRLTEKRLVRLDAAIAALPPLYKEPLILTMGGLTQEEAAKVLKVSTKAIEMRLRRARLSLTKVLVPD